MEIKIFPFVIFEFSKFFWKFKVLESWKNKLERSDVAIHLTLPYTLAPLLYLIFNKIIYNHIPLLEEGDMIKKMEELLRTDIEQTIQKDWVEIDNSTYWPYYRHLKTDINGEEYLYDGTKDEEKKKLWARARCGSIWRGQESRGGEMCRGCGQEKEIAKHAENCKEFEKRIGRKMEETDWTDRRRTTGNNKDDRRRTEERRTRRQTVKGRQTENKTRTRGYWNQIIYLL